MLMALVLLATALAAFLVFSKRKRKNLPPGPWGLPFIGQAFSVEWGHEERTLLKWSRQFGPVFRVNAGPETLVVVSDAELIRQAFNKPAASARMKGPVLDLLYADKGIIFTSGELWHRSRRFTLFHLRNLGMGRSKLEGAIQEQIQEFASVAIAPHEGRPISLDTSLNIAVVNIIWGMAAGETLGIQDTKVIEMMQHIRQIAEVSPLFFLLISVPALRHLPNWMTRLAELKGHLDVPIDQLLQPAIDEHRKTIDLEGEPRDYIDCLLQEQARSPELYCDRHILRCLIDLFLAGFDTTSTTLRWAFCLLCSRPEVQERMAKEILAVAGQRPPTLADRPRLPFTEAVLMETQRIGNIVPTGVGHVVTEDFELGGYTVPRGVQLISLLTAVHRNEKDFPEPYAFRPERFLDAEGKVKPCRALMPFSVGKRACLGESLARAELFLFVTSVVQKYRFRFPDGFQHDLSINDGRLFINEPKPYTLIPERR